MTTSTPNAGNLRHIATEPANLNQKVMNHLDDASKMLPKARSHMTASDSDLSVEAITLSQNSKMAVSTSAVFPSTVSSESRKPIKAEWEILEGLREGQRCEEKPAQYVGYMLKRRKWPMKGWHKRYFVLGDGCLMYSKNPSDIAKGKIHGSVDVGLSVISTRSRGGRIDIDAEEFIYHMKVRSKEMFDEWVLQLRQHRLHRQHEIAFGKDLSRMVSPVDEFLDGEKVPFAAAENGGVALLTRSPSVLGQSILMQNRVVNWLSDKTNLEDISKDISAVQETVFHLGAVVERLEGLYSSLCDVAAEENTTASANVKHRRKFHIRKKKAKSATGELLEFKAPSMDGALLNVNRALLAQQPPFQFAPMNIHEVGPLSSSNPNLSASDSKAVDPLDTVNVFPPGKNSENKLREEFVSSAKDVVSNFWALLRTLQAERDHIRQALEQESSSFAHGSCKASLTQALQLNADLRARLNKIHAESELTECSVSPEPANSFIHRSMSCEESSIVSVSEYFDAAEYMRKNGSSTEVSITDEEDEESFTSDNSETGTDYTPGLSIADSQNPSTCITGRRTKLPVPKPSGGDFNLWNLLCRNIGKDLSKVSMPVTLNEPLNTLQRLCEELEYCDILDKAAETDDPYERMVLVAAFAISPYGSSQYRAGHKPFNPLLGETYECLREDKGFNFLAEQVSHHPPISACHAESKNFIFYQDMRIKTTFWGKSMEVQPIGTVNVKFPKYDVTYHWNKVTTCVHNLFGGQRWVDQYGEMCITTGDVSCKLTFVKASPWSKKKQELHGSITNKGKVVRNLFGKWNEGLYCGTAPTARCIWRPGAMPEEQEKYYGFSRFAIELNEIDEEMAKLLPPTDTRFRPDQRLLEEGNVQGAENVKLQVEQTQRDRRRKLEEDGIPHVPKWFKKSVNEEGKELWEFTGEYWQTRKNPGFHNIQFEEPLWEVDDSQFR